METQPKKTLADNLNILCDWLALRDISSLTKEDLKAKYNIEKADLLILFGGSILEGCDQAAKAYIAGLSSHLMIVGGEGHTTQTLRDNIHNLYPEIITDKKMESECIDEYFRKIYNIKDAVLEKRSTNCGNNVSNALKICEEKGFNPKSIIIMQDTSMQRRMDAGFRKMWHKDTVFINYAAYCPKFIEKEGKIQFEKNNIKGMWTEERYISLLMGEIPRLAPEGYGPKGKNFIANVDIPEEVLNAHKELVKSFEVREANSAYKESF